MIQSSQDVSLKIQQNQLKLLNIEKITSLEIAQINVAMAAPFN
jgi:hypothetical protein